MRKFLTVYVEKDALQEDGIIPLAVASDASVDRDGDIVDVTGMDTTNYERNPVILYAHDYHSDPVGKTISLKKDGSRLLFTPQFAVNISERAKMYFEMIKEGVLSAFSIGFIVKEWTDRANSDGSTTRIFTKTELLEISLVPVPANANALVLAREYADKLTDGKEKETANSVVKDMELAAESIEKDRKAEERIAGIEASAKSAAETAEKALQVANEANEKAAKTTSEEVPAEQGEHGGQKAPTVKEIIAHPDFGKGVLRVVDNAIGRRLHSLNRGK